MLECDAALLATWERELRHDRLYRDVWYYESMGYLFRSAERGFIETVVAAPRVTAPWRPSFSRERSCCSS